VTTAGSGPLTLAFSPTESARFGLRVFRANLSAVDADALRAELESERVDVAILRIPARALGAVAALTKVGLQSIVADTLVHYSTALDRATLAVPKNALLRLRPAGDADTASIAAMARTIFADYISHYHANPLFAPDAIADGYAEWAARSVPANDEGRSAWIVELGGTAVGFSCIQICADRGEAHGVLNGILPAARGRGAYRDMLRATLIQHADAGIRRFVISTQVHNLVVQRVWADEGFRLDRAENTLHLSPLFGRERS